RARGRVAPSVESSREPEGITGGLVLDSRPGLYRNVLVFDFKSLYPSLIRTFNIDPLTHVPAPASSVDVIRTPGGAAFRRDEDGILPALVARLWDERAAARAAGDATESQAIKILMNSLFGVLGSPASRLFSPAVANAITLAGQHVIRLAAQAVERRGYRVIYGDTDSLFVDAGEADESSAATTAETLRAEVGDEVAAALAREFGCTSHLELEFEKVYTRFFLPEVRGGATGSKKRYAGLVGGRLEIVGLEAVRRDWSGVARRFQRELLELVLREEPVEDFVRDRVADLRAGKLDSELVYRKTVRKPHDARARESGAQADGHRESGRRLRGDARRSRARGPADRGPRSRALRDPAAEASRRRGAAIRRGARLRRPVRSAEAAVALLSGRAQAGSASSASASWAAARPAQAPRSTTAAGPSTVEPARKSPRTPGIESSCRRSGAQAQLIDWGAATR